MKRKEYFSFFVLPVALDFISEKLGTWGSSHPLCTKFLLSAFRFLPLSVFSSCSFYPISLFDLFFIVLPLMCHHGIGFVERRGYGWRCLFCAFFSSSYGSHSNMSIWDRLSLSERYQRSRFLFFSIYPWSWLFSGSAKWRGHCCIKHGHQHESFLHFDIFLKSVYCLFLSFTVIDILYAFKSGSPWGYINFSDLYRVVLLRFLYALIPCTKYNYNLDQFQFTIQSFSTLMQSSYGEIALSGLANITWLDAPPSRWAHRQLRLLRPARTLPRATEHYQTTFATGIRVYCLDFNPIWIFSGLCSIPKGPDRRRQKSFLPPT